MQLSAHQSTKPPLQIFVKTMGGKTVTVSCGEEDTILYLKTVINDKEGIPTMGQRLLWGGKELQNHYSLRFYCIHSEATLHLVWRLPGG
eukprot:UN34901